MEGLRGGNLKSCSSLDLAKCLAVSESTFVRSAVLGGGM
jgi:hypothetical protein